MLDVKGRPRVAPLVVTTLQPPGPGDDVVVPQDDEPHLTAGLLREEYFAAEDLARVTDDLPFGDAEASAGAVRAALTALGLDATAVDPAWLDPASLRRGGGRRVGAHNAAVAWRAPSAGPTRTVREDLRALRERGDWQRSAVRWLLEDVPPPPPEDEDASVASPTERALNDAQERALVRASHQPVTVVVGPPGTGKSELVAATVADAWLRGESVLVASTNNGAVQVAADRAATIHPGLLLRTGDKARRERLRGVLDELIARPVPLTSSPGLVEQALRTAVQERRALLAALSRRTTTEAELARAVLDVEESRRLLWRRPDVPGAHPRRRRLLRQARNAGRWWHPTTGGRVLHAAGVEAPGRTAAQVEAWALAECRVDELLDQLRGLEERDGELDQESLRRADAEWSAASRRAVVGTVATRLADGRTALTHLAGLRRTAPREWVSAVTRTLPYARGWATTAHSAGSTFPLSAGLFDLLVLDEASQCGIAEVLPLAYRARRIVVVGDPNQLDPVVTLRRRQLDALARTVGSTHTDLHAAGRSAADSAYSAFQARVGRPPLLLDEHYRCHPQIAAWVDQTFYDGQLKVLTDVGAQVGEVRGLRWVEAPGAVERLGTSWRNPGQAQAVVDWVLAHADEPGTLGVVTPFAGQADLIRERLRRAIGDEAVTRRDLLVGTAHAFQGEQRDVVLFPTVVAPGINEGTVGWLESNRHLVNVAASRAGRALVVFGDGRFLAASPAPTLAGLAAAARTGGSPTKGEVLRASPDLHSEAERRLYDALRAAGLEVRLKPVVQGYELDFALDSPADPSTWSATARTTGTREDASGGRTSPATGCSAASAGGWSGCPPGGR